MLSITCSSGQAHVLLVSPVSGSACKEAADNTAGIIVSNFVDVLDSPTRWINKIHITHIFEAKSQYGFDYALPYAVQEIAEWCGRTGCVRAFYCLSRPQQ